MALDYYKEVFMEKKKCDRCGRGFGLVSHRWWPYRLCSQKCKRETIAEVAQERKDYYKSVGRKPPDDEKTE